MSDLTHLSLFSGIGGIDLAAEWEHAERCTNPDCHDDEYNQDDCPDNCPHMIFVKVPKGAPEPE